MQAITPYFFGNNSRKGQILRALINVASSRHSVSQGETQKTAREKIKKTRAIFCAAPWLTERLKEATYFSRLFSTCSQCQTVVGEVCIRAKWPIRPELIPVSVTWSDWEYFYSPLDGMLVHRRFTPSIKFASTHLYTWVEREALWELSQRTQHNVPGQGSNPNRSLRTQAH